MIVRRGVGAFLPVGAPYFRAQGPLLPTEVRTIAGPEAFRGGRPRGLASGAGTRAVLRRGMRGLGDVTYCSNNPPSAAQADYLKTNHIPYSIVACGGAPTPQGSNQGNQPVSTIANPNAVSGAAPVFNPAYAGMENCVSAQGAIDAACVQRNTARSVANENTFLGQNRDYQTQLCVANGGGGWVPAGTDIGSWCANQYGGSVAPGYVAVASAGQSGTPVNPVPGSSAPSGPGVLSFKNLTTGNASLFNVGDQWSISITGAKPNFPVQVQGTQNGSTSTSTIGTTDSSGNFTTSGSMDASTVGTWSEAWFVGGGVSGPAVPVGTVAFKVLAPPAGGTTTTTTTTGGSGSTTGGTGGGSGAGGGGGGTVTPPATTFDIGSFLTGSAFMGIPNWMLLAGVGGVVLYMGKHQ